MAPEQSKSRKRPHAADRPFPWRCRHCGTKEVAMTTTEYTVDVQHDGRLYTLTVPDLNIPACGACGEKVFSEQVDRQVNEALRAHLKLLSPAQIREAIGRLDLSQKEFAQRLGIAEATLSRWLNETQIQSRSMDNLLRVFFALPQVRTVLCGESQDPELGAQLGHQPL